MTTAMEYGSLREKIAAESAKRRERYEGFAALYAKAHEAGERAAEACTPTPMVVGTPTTLLGSDIDHSKPTYYVADGVCGFAWVVVRPANSSFANWLKKTAKVRGGRSYGGGCSIWISAYGQSMQKKQAYAGAFAKVLCEAGIKAYADSRMD